MINNIIHQNIITNCCEFAEMTNKNIDNFSSHLSSPNIENELLFMYNTNKIGNLKDGFDGQSENSVVIGSKV